ncbi:MAG: type II secretion system F family protein [Candidatus Liptonbacteria bacterium]|nr:type II secretion system F family protein [Candidatus Liptonbacteria bacterium]
MPTPSGKNPVPKAVPKLNRFFNFGLAKEKDYFLENLAILLTSGLDIASAIHSIKAEIRSKKLIAAIDFLEEEIQGGSFLWKALEDTDLVPPHIIFLIRLGEETGRLPENLRIVASQQQKDRELKSKVRSAMIYPVIVFSLTLVIGTGISWFVLPRLAKIFSELRIKLPIITRITIFIGSFLGHYGALVVPIVIVVFAVSVYILFFYSKTRYLGQSILFSVPGIKKLIQEIELARFGYVLGNLLDAGLLVTRSLDSLHQATVVRRYQKFYLHLRDSIEEGKSFHEGFTNYPKISKLIPTPVQQMIISGVESGRLSETLIKIGEIFDKKADTTTKNMAIILEPILLVIVWLGVIAVALSVILPIYSLLGGINKS